ncbi:MAG TPA: hypothetical protein VMS92_23560 [Mycobacterium sp.]|nr:hypothetical protein [Mycobacterium sp.]
MDGVVDVLRDVVGGGFSEGRLLSNVTCSEWGVPEFAEGVGELAAQLLVLGGQFAVAAQRKVGRWRTESSLVRCRAGVGVACLGWLRARRRRISSLRSVWV